MSLPHFYLEDQVLADEADGVFPLRLSPGDAKHARVLRLAPGEHVAVVDAVRDYFECEVVDFSDAMPLVRIAQRLDDEGGRPTVVLVQGLAKGDKMDAVVRHATELGVAGFVPLACERSIVKLDAKKAAARAERWRAVAKSAAMQSGQRAVPEVAEPTTVEGACGLLANATALLVCWEEAPRTAHIDEAIAQGLMRAGAAPEDARIAVVVGPEGGLAEREVEALLGCNPRSSLVTLGPSILRTETAGVVAPTLVLYELARMARCGAEAGERLHGTGEMRGVR
ncbi:RNA methyltransferase [Gordonibacter sp. 28C]|uniref:RsmE family RNA methyltransferase n=1 Tax=Gordonibacter sp. 28C TaxID=2078569 RepID=UPI000DF7AA89|nr:16S rRNA (uracil(1498)-N(3))-methyltransferase [Gordonibacter sp. 28C]RDB62329.1 RNA methyltransferase [Gordonibacter sp. 28C]